jgi:hypothetical protein
MPSLSTAHSFKDVVVFFISIFQLIIPIIFFLALLYFFWGVVEYLYYASSDAKEIDDARTKIWWGIVGLFVMTSVFGIILFVKKTLLG